MVTIDVSTPDIIIDATVNDITINVNFGGAVTNLGYLEGDNLFRINGATEDTGHKYDTSEDAIIFYIDGTEVGRMRR